MSAQEDKNEASWGTPNEVNVDDSKEIFRKLSRQFSKEQQTSNQSSDQQQRKSVVSDATVKEEDDDFDLHAFITVSNRNAYKAHALTFLLGR